MRERDIVTECAGAEADSPRRPSPASIEADLGAPWADEERLSAAAGPGPFGPRWPCSIRGVRIYECRHIREVMARSVEAA